MTRAAEVEEAVVAGLARVAEGKPKRSRVAEGALLVKPLARELGAAAAEVERALKGHAALEVRDVRATRLFGIFKRTRPDRGVALREGAAVVAALEAGAEAPSSSALLARCLAALGAAEPAAGEGDFAGAWRAGQGPSRVLSPLALLGAERVEVSSEAAGAEAARVKSQLARLRRFAPGGGFEFGERSRANSPMAALEAILQGPPGVLARALTSEEFERWLRDDCKERELADLATATRLRSAADGLDAAGAKRLFVRLLSYAPVREAVAAGVLPAFVGRLTSASESEAEEIVAALEGLGSESVLEALVRSVYEVEAEARPRVLMAMGAVGSPRVLEPLERLALHAKDKGDRVEAAAAVLRIAGRFPGARAQAARRALEESGDDEVRAMLGGKAERGEE